MGKKNDVFQRIEKKYILTSAQYVEFRKAIEPYMTLDQFGYHAICNIYYDTPEDELIIRSMEKPRYKEKLRLRTYGIGDMEQEAFIEIKKKFEKVVYKRRVAMPYKEAVRYLNNGIRPKKDCQILHEIDYFMQFYKPIPKLYLAYDREAFFGKEDPDFRLTIDHNIRYRENNLSLTAPDEGEYYFDNHEKVLEIKVSGSFPLWLSRILADLQIYPRSFSKYGSIYQKIHRRQQKEQVQQAPNVGGYRVCSQA